MEGFDAWCEAEVRRLLALAEDGVSRFWTEHLNQRQGEYAQWGAYGVRARLVKHTLSIDWYRLRFVGPKGKRKLRSDYIRKGKGDRYTIHQFPDAREWERPIIEELEGELFSRLRYSARALGEVRKRWQMYRASCPEPSLREGGV